MPADFGYEETEPEDQQEQVEILSFTVHQYTQNSNSFEWTSLKLHPTHPYPDFLSSRWKQKQQSSWSGLWSHCCKIINCFIPWVCYKTKKFTLSYLILQMVKLKCLQQEKLISHSTDITGRSDFKPLSQNSTVNL